MGALVFALAPACPDDIASLFYLPYVENSLHMDWGASMWSGTRTWTLEATFTNKGTDHLKDLRAYWLEYGFVFDLVCGTKTFLPYEGDGVWREASNTATAVGFSGLAQYPADETGYTPKQFRPEAE